MQKIAKKISIKRAMKHSIVMMVIALIFFNFLANSMETQEVEQLPIQSFVKQPDGTFITLSYNPYLHSMVQETKDTQGFIRSILALPLKNITTKVPLKVVSPCGFIQVSGKLFAIAKATASNVNDHALFFSYNSNPLSFNACSVNEGVCEIKNISMHACAGNLLVTILVQNDANRMQEFSVTFNGYTTDVKHRSDKRERHFIIP